MGVGPKSQGTQSSARLWDGRSDHSHFPNYWLHVDVESLICWAGEFFWMFIGRFVRFDVRCKVGATESVPGLEWTSSSLTV